jgi:hypothetical protein
VPRPVRCQRSLRAVRECARREGGRIQESRESVAKTFWWLTYGAHKDATVFRLCPFTIRTRARSRCARFWKRSRRDRTLCHPHSMRPNWKPRSSGPRRTGIRKALRHSRRLRLAVGHAPAGERVRYVPGQSRRVIRAEAERFETIPDALPRPPYPCVSASASAVCDADRRGLQAHGPQKILTRGSIAAAPPVAPSFDTSTAIREHPLSAVTSQITAIWLPPYGLGCRMSRGVRLSGRWRSSAAPVSRAR